MSLRSAAIVVLTWAVLTLALHLVGGRHHVGVLAGSLGSPLSIALGLATVITHLAGVLVVGPCLVVAGVTAIANRVWPRRQA
jgi:hypothetical protein